MAKPTEAQERVTRFLTHVDVNNKKHRDAVWRALQFLYNRQTMSEQNADVTHDNNGRGFSAFDADLLSKIAKTSGPYYSLTPKQASLVARRLLRYSRQLSEMVKGEKPQSVAAPSNGQRPVKVKGKGFECDVRQFTRTEDRLVAEASDLQFPAGKWPRSLILRGVGVPLEYMFRQFIKTNDRDNEVIRAEYSTEAMPGAPLIVVLND